MITITTTTKNNSHLVRIFLIALLFANLFALLIDGELLYRFRLFELVKRRRVWIVGDVAAAAVAAAAAVVISVWMRGAWRRVKAVGAYAAAYVMRRRVKAGLSAIGAARPLMRVFNISLILLPTKHLQR